MKNRGESPLALVLAGGQSSRLFPFNKILSDLTGSGRTLLQQTYERVCSPAFGQPLLKKDQLYVLTHPSVIPNIRKQIPIPKPHCFADPVRRGTWPAILWALAHLRRSDPHAVIAVLTADHLMTDPRGFRRIAKQVVALARARPIFAVIGVAPSRDPDAWRPYGSMRKNTRVPESAFDGGPLRAFEEKPSLERARKMIRDGHWFWNSGMFFFRISTAEEALGIYQPKMHTIYTRLSSAVAAGKQVLAAKIFSEFPEKIRHPTEPGRQVDNTIDYAIMMPLVRQPECGLEAWIAAEPLRHWADVGDWITLGRLLSKDRRGNVALGHVVLAGDNRGNIIAADQGMNVKVQGLVDWIVAFSKGRALIIPKSRVSDIKALVAAARGSLVTADAADLEIERTPRQLTVCRPKR